MGSMNPPKKSPTAQNTEARRTNVLLESLQSQFRTFGEELQSVREKVERMEPKIDQMTEDVELLKLISKKNADDIQTLKGWAIKYSNDNESIKLELKLVRDEVKSVSKRLESAEARLPA
jgi:chromosome segregation ATPase